MLGILNDILCVLRNVLLAIAYAGVEVVNAIVLAIGAFATALIGLLPAMPDPPSPPDGGVLGAVAWMYPVGAMVALLVTFVSLWGIVTLLRAALRWVKLL